jgi:hypothetical protein
MWRGPGGSGRPFTEFLLPASTELPLRRRFRGRRCFGLRLPADRGLAERGVPLYVLAPLIVAVAPTLRISFAKSGLIVGYGICR